MDPDKKYIVCAYLESPFMQNNAYETICGTCGAHLGMDPKNRARVEAEGHEAICMGCLVASLTADPTHAVFGPAMIGGQDLPLTPEAKDEILKRLFDRTRKSGLS